MCYVICTHYRLFINEGRRHPLSKIDAMTLRNQILQFYINKFPYFIFKNNYTLLDFFFNIPTGKKTVFGNSINSKVQMNSSSR